MKTRGTKAGEWLQVLPQGALSLLRLSSTTGHGVDGTPSAPTGAATQHGDPSPSAPGTFAMPNSSLQIISHFFPYHQCSHLPACFSPAPSVGSGIVWPQGSSVLTEAGDVPRAGHDGRELPGPASPARYANGKKPTKKVRKNPTNHMSQQCTPVFCTLIV